MRRLAALFVLGLLLLGAVLVLYLQGQRGIEQEAERLAREARERREAALVSVRRELAGELQALLAREGERPFYHWRHLYLPPDLVAKNVALVPSPIAGPPTEPLVELYFELRDQRVWSPAFLGLRDLAREQAPNEWAESIRLRLVELGGLRPELDRAFPPPQGGAAPTALDSLERLDWFACATNSGPLLLNDAQQLEQEQYTEAWNEYQGRQGKTSGSYEPRKQQGRGQNLAPQQGQQGQQAPQTKQAVEPPMRGEIDVRRTPFQLAALQVGADGWPRWVLAARWVVVPPASPRAQPTSWLQGFVLDVRRLREEVLPALMERIAPVKDDPAEEDPWTERLRAATLSSGTRPGRAGLALLPARAAPRDAPSARLAAPLDELALVLPGAPPAPRELLRGSRQLLRGALFLALLVVGAGALILIRAALAERRLARQRSDFVAALTHELKAPLTGIRALAELLHDGVVSEDARRQEYYASILGESERLGRLVQNVLDASRLERGATLQLACRELALGPLVEEVARSVRPRLQAAGVELVTDVAELPPVLADREAVGQILSNLLDNALKYGRPAAGPQRIELLARPGGKGVVLAVRDHGPGIPPAQRERVFERYWRSPDAPREVGGAGLGLWIAREQARAMQGELALVPAEGPGACFRLELPAS